MLSQKSTLKDQTKYILQMIKNFPTKMRNTNDQSVSDYLFNCKKTQLSVPATSTSITQFFRCEAEVVR